MMSTNTLDELGDRLFTDYSLAVTPGNDSGTARSMVLMVRDGDDVKFFVLSRDGGRERPFYSLCSWPAGEAADGSGARGELIKAAPQGLVPIPRHGSLLGWAHGSDITALIAFYARYSPKSPEPYWAVLPLADVPEASWPPFTDWRFFGSWFWDYCEAGSICSLDDLIAETPGAVFWVNTTAALGSDCCAVARDVTSRKGYTLRRGRYVYYEALRAGKPVPPLQVLLAAADTADLTSRFRRPERAMSGYPAVARTGRQEQCRPVSINGGTIRNKPGEKSRSALFARFRPGVRR